MRCSRYRQRNHSKRIFQNSTPHPSFALQNPPISPVGSVGDKRLPPASIAPQGEGFFSSPETAEPYRKRYNGFNKIQICRFTIDMLHF